MIRCSERQKFVLFSINTIMHKNYADSTNEISIDGNIVKQLSYGMFYLIFSVFYKNESLLTFRCDIKVA